MDWQSVLMLVSVCVLVALILVAVGLFGYDQIMQYFDRRKIQRMVRRELAHVRQEELVEWLRERGANQ